MALKFLNKKGWHTGSLRNIENVWKAEQKHDAEQKKLEELRKQIHEERERAEFHLLQEQAGLVPKQERLEFLYDSGLAVGKGSSDGFKALESLPKTDPEIATSSSTKQQQPVVPGALFEERPQSANDAWRKLHSDPLLLIRQREQEALARVKNNPIQMAMIRKSVEAKKQEKTPARKERREKYHHKKSKHQKYSPSRPHFNLENVTAKGEGKRNTSDRKSSKYDELSCQAAPISEDESSARDVGRKKNSHKDLKYKEWSPSSEPTTEKNEGPPTIGRNHDKSKGWMDSESARKGKEDGKFYQTSHGNTPNMASRSESHHKHRTNTIKLSDEERAARLREMQMDAKLHEEQRWKRLRKAEDDDAQEAIRARMSNGRNFLDAAKKSVYGAEKGGSSTIEESVRRRSHYSQGKSQVRDGYAFRRKEKLYAF